MIEAYIHSKCYPKDGTGMIVRLVFKDHSGVHERTRALKWPIKITSYQSLIRSLEYVMNSIKPEFRGQEITVFTTKDKYMERMFGRLDGKFVKEEKTIELNRELITGVRALMVDFPKMEIKFVDLNESSIFKSLDPILTQAIRTGDEHNKACCGI